MSTKSINFLLLLGLVFSVAFAYGAKLHDGKEKVTKIKAKELKQMMEKKDFLLINVHIPYAGEIAQTDLFIPYDQIDQFEAKLAKDKNQKIVLYCRSGHMSAITAKKLSELGYQNVYDLEGGMNAWKEAGFEIISKEKKPDDGKKASKSCCQG